MNKSIFNNRKFKHGSVSVALTVLIIAAVIILNVIASALATRFSWMYLDMTAEGLYTLSDDCIKLLDRSFVDIVEERKALNVELPKTNAEIAKENISIAENNIKLAENAKKTAEANLEAAKINKLLFEQSEIHAKRNLNIATNNLESAKDILKHAKDKVGIAADGEVPDSLMNDELAAALGNLAIAEENVKIAEENLKIVGQNRANKLTNDENEAYNKQNELKEGDAGYKALLPYTELKAYKDFIDVSSYKYPYSLDKHIIYENMNVATLNLENSIKNLESAKQNLEIAKQNKTIADQNAAKDVIAGESGYTSLGEYVTLLEFKPFTTITGFEEKADFSNPTKAEPFEAEKELYNEDVKIKIIFCDVRDNLESNETQNMVLNTALDLQEKFPKYISVEYIDIWNNYTAVQKYKTTSYTTITSTNVIVESGSEFRIISLRGFYSFNSSEEETPWGYNGEKVMTAAILAVSQAESPIACVTINHTETFTDYELFYTLETAGYKVQTIDLAYQEIPDDCRLVVIYNPKEDFMQADGISEISEIEKLDRYLNGLSCSMMVFVDANTPKLPNLEEYLEEWGVTINRHTNSLGETFNYTVKEDASVALSTDGYTFSGTYVTKGLGASLTKTLLENAYPPTVVFKNATSLGYSPLYTQSFYVNYDDPEDTEDEYWLGAYYSNGNERNVFDVFTTTDNAIAMANGSAVKTLDTEYKFQRLVTLTRETRMIDNENVDYAHVMVCASTDFANEKLLGSAVYGNQDVILSAARGMGKEFVAVDLKIKPFASTEISKMTTQSKTTWTTVLAVVPAVIVTGLGVFVLVRRKYS
jgi:hypothetical protein